MHRRARPGAQRLAWRTLGHRASPGKGTGGQVLDSTGHPSRSRDRRLRPGIAAFIARPRPDGQALRWKSRNVVCWPGAWTPASKREVRPSQSAARRSAAHFVTVTNYRLAEIFGAPRQFVSGDADSPISRTSAGPNRLSRNRFRRANTVIEPARSKRPLAGADQSQAPAN